MNEPHLGYRQRTLLYALRERGRPVPFGWLTRLCADDCPSSYNNTSVSLRALRQRGLVRQTRRGWWEAA